MSDKPSFFAELKRRHVFRVAIAYAVTAWLLLQLAAIVLPTFAAPHWVLKVLIGVFVLCFPLAILLAWAFEVTPGGVRRTVPVEAEAARPAGHGRRVARVLNIGIIVVLAAAVGVLAWQRFATVPKPKAAHVAATPAAAGAAAVSAAATAVSPKSIAVLPFENLSPDKNNAYFADGMQDVILSKLAEIGGLTVISRTSTLRYQSHPEDLKSIGRQLGVANLLEGSVQKAGDQVLINVQLIDARTDHHLWAHSYQRTLENIFGVEGEVAEKVAAALKAKLDPAEQARVASVPTRNPAAYDAYLRGLSLGENTSGFGPAGLEAQRTAFAQAVKLDPNFALAWGQLSSIDSIIHFEGFDPSPTRLAKAKAALDRALTLAPDATATQLAVGDYNYHGLRDYPAAIAAYRKVLAVAPNNVHALAYIGYVERRLGHWQTSIDYQERALRFDPRNVGTLVNLAQSYWALYRFSKAADLLHQALAINPGDPLAAAMLAGVYQSQGQLTQAAKVLAGAKIPPNDLISYGAIVSQKHLMHRYADAVHLLRKALATPNLPKAAQGNYYQLLGYSEQLAGNQQAARHAYRRAVDILKQVPPAPQILGALALAQAGLGEKDAAMASLHRASQILPVSRDAYVGPIHQFILMQVQIQLGEKAQVIATLKQLLAMPPGSLVSTNLTPSFLRLAPTWKPLRRDPAFQALIREAQARIRTPAGSGR